VQQTKRRRLTFLKHLKPHCVELEHGEVKTIMQAYRANKVTLALPRTADGALAGERGFGVYPHLSLVNHSCRPNVCRWDGEEGCASKKRGGKKSAAAAKAEMQRPYTASKTRVETDEVTGARTLIDNAADAKARKKDPVASHIYFSSPERDGAAAAAGGADDADDDDEATEVQRFVLDEESGRHLPFFEERGMFDNSSHLALRLRAVTDIPAGTEITHCYLDLGWPLTVDGSIVFPDGEVSDDFSELDSPYESDSYSEADAVDDNDTIANTGAGAGAGISDGTVRAGMLVTDDAATAEADERGFLVGDDSIEEDEFVGRGDQLFADYGFRCKCDRCLIEAAPSPDDDAWGIHYAWMTRYLCSKASCSGTRTPCVHPSCSGEAGHLECNQCGDSVTDAEIHATIRSFDYHDEDEEMREKDADEDEIVD
jgi:hypothetical protein